MYYFSLYIEKSNTYNHYHFLLISKQSTREERLSNIDRSVARSELSVQITPRNTNKLTGYKECFKSSIKLFQMNVGTHTIIIPLSLYLLQEH